MAFVKPPEIKTNIQKIKLIFNEFGIVPDSLFLCLQTCVKINIMFSTL